MNKLIKLMEQSYSQINKFCKQCHGALDINNNPIISQDTKNTKPNLTTDAIVIRNNKEILLIKRKHDPFKNKYAFPGGFVDYNEDPQDGCLRELLEETKIKAYKTKLFTVKSDPQRDPRKHVISLFYLVEVEDEAVPEAADDALTAKFYSLESIIKKGRECFAFDHYDILEEYLSQNKIKY